MIPLSPGAVIDNKYAVERLLGEGGMGVVWLARDMFTEVPVVLKAIRTEYTHRKDFRDRILAEGRALARIDHPNVVQLKAVVSEGNDLCLVMQYVDGETLEERITRHAQGKTPFPVAEAQRIFRQIVLGVSAAHGEGIIHRDLKPANVLIRGKDGVVKVTDFGIAKAEEDAQQGRGQTQGTIGSALYMAPEQCTAQKDQDIRIDIYALGVVLFELLTGRVPFTGESNFDIMLQHTKAPFPQIRDDRGDVPGWLDDIARRCAEKKREDRFSSCAELLAALDRGGARAEPATQPNAPLLFTGATKTEPGGPPIGVAHPPHFARTETEQPLAAPGRAPAREAGAGRRLAIPLTIVLAAGLGLGITYALGWLGPSKPQIEDAAIATSAPPLTGAAGPAAGKAPSTAAPQSALAELAGAWKSDSGRLYDAALAGDGLEIRIREPGTLAAQGYVEGETRFVLRAIPGKGDVFALEDRLRPLPPAGFQLDPDRSREPCLVTYTSLAGKPLEARLEGGKLRAQTVRIEPVAKNFALEGKRVVGCKDLEGARTSIIESNFTRP
jgi:eukaryotic-like serine/threonine-protein kinase